MKEKQVKSIQWETPGLMPMGSVHGQIGPPTCGPGTDPQACSLVGSAAVISCFTTGGSATTECNTTGGSVGSIPPG